VLTAGLIRDNLQAHLALARVGEQPPSPAPTSLPVWTTCEHPPPTRAECPICDRAVTLRAVGTLLLKA
jgi:hypothetical protein